MSDLDFVKILNQTTEKERKTEKNFSEFVHNFGINWKKANDVFRYRLVLKKKEEITCQSLDDQIDKVEAEIQVTRSNILSCELQTAEMKVKLSHVENEIMAKSDEQRKLNKHHDVLEMNKNKLKKALMILKETELIYDKFVSCNLRDEGSNIYVFSFICDGQVIGAIKFKFNEHKNHFAVLDFQPVNIVPDNVIQKFTATQDTQWLLCYFRQLLQN